MAIGSMTPATSGGADFKPIPADNHPAICVAVLDLGTHDTVWQGTAKKRHTVRIVFETPFAKMEDGRPFIVSTTQTASMAPNATLRKLLEGWRGRPFGDTEQVEWRKLLGQTCMVNVTHDPKPDGTIFAGIKSITRIPANPETKQPLMTLPAPTLPLHYLDLSPEGFSASVFDRLGDKTREQISKSYEFKQMFPQGLWPKPQGGGTGPAPVAPQASAGDVPPEWAGEAGGAPGSGDAYDDDIPF